MADTGGGTNGTKGSEDEKIVIKKYANRRLYNTARSSYVTLDDLAQMVRSGEDFAVFDAKTGEDITRSVLTQIIVEEEGREQNMLPTKFLRGLICLYGDPLQGIVPGYLDAAMEAFSQNQEQIRRAFGGAGAMQNFEALARSNMEIFERSLRMFAPFGKPGQETPPPEPQRKEPAREVASDDLDALRKQLREMQVQIEKLSRGKG